MKKIFILLILGMLVLPTIQVMAQDSDTYTLLAPLPGLTEISQDKALEKYVCTRQLNELKAQMDIKWGYLCYGALWYDPIMQAI